MNANELRIGNIVYVDNNKCHPHLENVYMVVKAIRCDYHNREDFVVTIERLDKQVFDVYVDYAQLIRFVKPVLLTEELLLKCGFRFEDNAYYSPKDKNWLVLKIMGGEGSYHAAMNRFLAIKIKYLHQLQNFYFALTGEELEVKL